MRGREKKERIHREGRKECKRLFYGPKINFASAWDLSDSILISATEFRSRCDLFVLLFLGSVGHNHNQSFFFFFLTKHSLPYYHPHPFKETASRTQRFFNGKAKNCISEL